MFLCEDCHLDEVCLSFFMPSLGPCKNCRRVAACGDCHCGTAVRKLVSGPEQLAVALDLVARAHLIRVLEDFMIEADLGPGPEDDEPYELEEEEVPNESDGYDRALDPDGWCC